MMKAVATAVDTVERAPGQAPVQPLYLEALTLVERLHRRLLDVIKDEFDRRGRADINSVQALLLYNIGDKELTAGELRTRGYYLGSNVSYNLKKLVELGFLDHQRSRVDRRSVRIRLTAQGQEIRRIVDALYQKHVKTVEQVGGISNEEFATLNKSLHRLERFWTDQILYRLGYRLVLFRPSRPRKRPVSRVRRERLPQRALVRIFRTGAFCRFIHAKTANRKWNFFASPGLSPRTGDTAMLVERGLRVMNVGVIGDAYAIAADYLCRTGAVADTLATDERLLGIIVQLFERGEFNKIRLANKAIAKFEAEALEWV